VARVGGPGLRQGANVIFKAVPGEAKESVGSSRARFGSFKLKLSKLSDISLTNYCWTRRVIGMFLLLRIKVSHFTVQRIQGQAPQVD
jgi:hypothetical protein